MRNNNMTRNFLRIEFACKGANCCGGAAPISPVLVSLLQSVRTAIDRPLIITSGFRCPTHNATVAGASPDSYHTIGWAADITASMPTHDLRMAVERAIAEAGYGYHIYYPDRKFVHVDIRNYF